MGAVVCCASLFFYISTVESRNNSSIIIANFYSPITYLFDFLLSLSQLLSYQRCEIIQHIMATTLSLILLAAGATAQVTTSFYMPLRPLGTDKVTYLGSVVAADGDRLTLAIVPNNDTNYSELIANPDKTQTYTFASTLLEFSTTDMGVSEMGIATATGPREASSWGLHEKCEIPSTGSEVRCTVSYGSEIRRMMCFETEATPRPAETATQLWTYSNSETAGVETIIRTFPAGPTTAPPDFCSNSDAPIPSSELEWVNSGSKEAFAPYKIIITAGEEKMKPTAGGVATTSGPEPTGAKSTGTEPTGSETDNGASAPMRTMVPALAGLGAVAAVFL